jgi:hypothetical protein
VLSVEHPDTLASVSNLATGLQNQGKYEAGEEMNRRALEGSEKVLGVEHPDALSSLHWLGYLLHKKSIISRLATYLKEHTKGLRFP